MRARNVELHPLLRLRAVRQLLLELSYSSTAESPVVKCR